MTASGHIAHRFHRTDKNTLFSFGIIIESMRRVAFNVTEGHGTVQEKVGEMMGGQIMELDWIKAWRKAEAEGRAEGRVEDIKIFISDKREDGKSDDEIRERLKKYYGLDDSELGKFF